MKDPTFWSRGVKLAVLGVLAVACEPGGSPRTDSQTNWYRSCRSDADCGELDCLCGACTRACDAECSGLAGAECLPAADAGTIALCDGSTPPGAGLCLPRCVDAACADGEMCVSGVCTPLPQPTARVAVDTSVRYQTLDGFGATLAYLEREVVQHPRKAELYEAMFAGLGLDVLRLRNRYGYPDDDDLSSAGEIVGEATLSLARPPTLLLTSWSPPVALKANAALECAGNADTCTLARAADGGFDYAGFAAHWRASLDAYAAAGVTPDFIGIQNNPDFVPTAATPGEGCRFLPTEGSATVSVNGVDVEVEYPGFAEALTATIDAVADLATAPRIVAPETAAVQTTAGYVASLDVTQVDAIAHHLYGMDPSAVDLSALGALGELGQSLDRPLWQSEMQSDGLGTAVLMHHALAVEGASAYLHGVLAGPESLPAVLALGMIAVGPADFVLLDPYHALRHYAHDTDPGWTRIDASVDGSGLLATAWLSGDEGAMTLVLVNAGPTAIDAELALGEAANLSSEVTRTVFSGVERSAALGELSPEGLLRIPGQAVVTVTLRP